MLSQVLSMLKNIQKEEVKFIDLQCLEYSLSI